MSPDHALLRHTLATLAYRGRKALAGAPPEFGEFPAGDAGRTTGRILAHIGDLLDWGLALAEGRKAWNDSEALPWDQGTERFFAALAALDAFLASGAAMACSSERLFQGPIADALTHVGQIAMLRRMAGCPMKGENYYIAEIDVGRVGPDQTPPRREFE